MAEDVELTLVTLSFDAGTKVQELAGVLARYVVLSRGEQGCRNIDLCRSQTRPGRFLIVEKWGSADAARAHLDSGAMVDMAKACRSLLDHKPEIDLFDSVSAHDLA